MDKPVLMVVFDGVCGLCARTVRFFFEREQGVQFYFVPIQSPAGRVLAQAAGIDPDDPETFAVIGRDGVVRTKSIGAFFALQYCRPPWRFAGHIARLLPRFVTDRAYDFIARRRLLWFGTSDVCELGPAELRQRLVERVEQLDRLEFPRSQAREVLA